MRLVAPPGPARADNAQQSCVQSSPKKTTENLQYKKLVIFSGLKPGRGSEHAFCHIIMTSSCKYEPLDVNLSVHVPADKISLTHWFLKGQDVSGVGQELSGKLQCGEQVNKFSYLLS